uniref:DDE-1 domain-containing protein n=1 Tax=Spongospora subterranea TaxID=70186 RepID=A0A0H5QS34_9EUKA|eukprot:CRZ04482.1 hypothetical protein [Spongospora subterranea]
MSYVYEFRSSTGTDVYPVILRFSDVAGDGACFYHALAKHPSVPFANGLALKEHMFREVLREEVRFHPLSKYSDWAQNAKDYANTHLGDPKKYADETTPFFVTAVLGIDVITINVFGEVFRPSVMMLDSTDPAVRILVRLPLVNAFVLHHTFGKSNQWHLQSEIACQRNQLNHFGALLGSESLCLPATVYLNLLRRTEVVMAIGQEHPAKRKKTEKWSFSSRDGVPRPDVTPLTKVHQSSIPGGKEPAKAAGNQKILLKWLSSHKNNFDLASKLDALVEHETKRRSARNLFCSIRDVDIRDDPDSEDVHRCILEMVSHVVSTLSNSQPSPSSSIVPLLSKRTKELSWLQRSAVVFFYLHPKLGRRDYQLTSKVFARPKATIKYWVTSIECNRAIGVHLTSMTAKSIESLLPEQFRNLAAPDSKVHFVIRVSDHAPKQSLLVNGSDGLSCQALSAKARLVNDNAQLQYLPGTLSRRAGAGRPNSFLHIRSRIVEMLDQSWESGRLITTEQLYQLIRNEFSRDEKFFTAKLDSSKKSHPNSLHQFVRRVLQDNRFSTRTPTVSQSIPLNWKELAENNAEYLRKLFRSKNVDVVITADEVFLKFHKIALKAIAKTGERHIGNIVQAHDEKLGATVMVACELLTSQLLPAMIIFTGKFGKRLCDQYQHHKPSLITFNEQHWMNTTTFKMYLRFVMGLFPNRTIGLTVDRCRQHYGTEIDSFVDTLNKDESIPGKIVLGYIGEGLTPILQVPDVCINRALKQRIQSKYYLLRNDKAPQFRPGEKFHVTRDDMIGIIESVINEINFENRQSKWIANAFVKCGQDPWSVSLAEFRRHLDDLATNSLYAAMLKHQQALKL